MHQITLTVSWNVLVNHINEHLCQSMRSKCPPKAHAHMIWDGLATTLPCESQNIENARAHNTRWLRHRWSPGRQTKFASSVLQVVVVMDDFDNKGRKVCCKVSLYKNCQRQSCIAFNCLSSGINTTDTLLKTYATNVRKTQYSDSYSQKFNITALQCEKTPIDKRMLKKH